MRHSWRTKTGAITLNQLVYALCRLKPWLYRALATVTAMRHRRASAAALPCVQVDGNGSQSSSPSHAVTWRQIVSRALTTSGESVGLDGCVQKW